MARAAPATPMFPYQIDSLGSIQEYTKVEAGT